MVDHIVPRFKLTPLTDTDKHYLEGYQVHLFFQNFEAARYCYAALLLRRLCNPDEYNELVELSNEEQQELRKELFDSLNETAVWELHGRN